MCRGVVRTYIATATLFCALLGGAYGALNPADDDSLLPAPSEEHLAPPDAERGLTPAPGVIVGHYLLHTRLHRVGESLTALSTINDDEALSASSQRQSPLAVDYWHSPQSAPALLPRPRAGSSSIQRAGRSSYTARDQIGRGANGDVWRASRVDAFGAEVPGHDFVLKRILSTRTAALSAARREVYFGSMRSVRRAAHVTEFVEWFARSRDGSTWDAHTAMDRGEDGLEPRELWLVFRYAGQSLHQLMFVLTPPRGTDEQQGAYATALMVPSPFWTQLQLDGAGHAVLREMMHQVLTGLAELHDAGVVHRDMKPSNVLFESVKQRMKVRVADLGSSVLARGDSDPSTLYPDGEPSIAEATLEYAPPEVRLGSERAFDAAIPHSYDIFSTAMMMLEILLGRPASELVAVTSRHAGRIRSMLCRGAGDDCRVDDDSGQRAVLAYGYGCLCIAPAQAVAAVDGTGCAADVWSEANKPAPPCDAHEFTRRLRTLLRHSRRRAQHLHAQRGRDADAEALTRAYPAYADTSDSERALQHIQDSATSSADADPNAEALVPGVRAHVFDATSHAIALVMPHSVAADYFSLPAPPWADYSLVFRTHDAATQVAGLAVVEAEALVVAEAQPDVGGDEDNSHHDEQFLVPDDALEMLYHMLAWEPACRPSARQLLQHRYFQRRGRT